LQRSNNEVRHNHHPETTAGRRLAVALLMGLVAGGVIAAVGPLRYAPLVAWDTVAILYASAVTDTQLQHKDIRATVLKQALLAYVFGTVIIATAINAAVSLSGS
jgi:hypothetical protein